MKMHEMRAVALCALTTLAACGGGGSGSTTPEQPQPVKRPDPIVNVKAEDTVAYVGDFVAFNAGANETGVSYRWDFSDGLSDTGPSVEHQFATPGTYSANLSAQNTTGAVVKGSATVQILEKPVRTAHPANQWYADCSGPVCGVDDAGRYSGKGLAVWRYDNTTSETASIDVDVGGLAPGQTVALVFSNGSSRDLSQIPTAGVGASQALQASFAAAEPGANSPLDRHREDRAHARQQADQQLAKQELLALQKLPAPQALSSDAPRRHAAESVSIGSTRVWNDLYDHPTQPVPYKAHVQASCDGSAGRRIVFWVDDTLTKLTDAVLNKLQSSFCGPTGGMSRTTALLGEVWGSGADTRWYWIKDSAGRLQDVNIVIVNPPSGTDWAGYFTPRNNVLRSGGGNFANSNEALAFFINGSGLIANPPYYVSTLVHELTHMINYYQRWVLHGLSHEAWLEETSAMISEDLLVGAISDYRKITTSRLPGYMATGGGVSLMKWADLDDSHYDMGGSFAAFLNRRYGLSIAQQLISDCTVSQASYDCLDSIIKKNGGAGLADEFHRMGASLFGGMPGHGAPWGYGYRKRKAGEYLLDAVDTAALSYKLKSDGMTQLSGFDKTSQSYTIGIVPSGSTRYVRRAVQVPGSSSLSVVVR